MEVNYVPCKDNEFEKKDKLQNELLACIGFYNSQDDERLHLKKMNWSYTENNRIGDHIWWISDVRKFKSHFPDWNFKYGINDILEELFNQISTRHLK